MNIDYEKVAEDATQRALAGIHDGEGDDVAAALSQNGAMNEYAAASIVQRDDAVYLAHTWTYDDKNAKAGGINHEWDAFSTREAAERFCENHIGRKLPWTEAQRSGNRPRWDAEVQVR